MPVLIRLHEDASWRGVLFSTLGVCQNISQFVSTCDGGACSVFCKPGLFVYIVSAGVRSVEFYLLCIFLCAEHGRSPFLGASSSVALSFRFVFILVFLALVTWGPNACGVVVVCAMHGTSS